MNRNKVLCIEKAPHSGLWIEFVPGVWTSSKQAPSSLRPCPIALSDEQFSILGGPITHHVHCFSVYDDVVVPWVSLAAMAADLRSQAVKLACESSRSRIAEQLDLISFGEPYNQEEGVALIRRNAAELANWFVTAARECRYVSILGF